MGVRFEKLNKKGEDVPLLTYSTDVYIKKQKLDLDDYELESIVATSFASNEGSCNGSWKDSNKELRKRAKSLGAEAVTDYSLSVSFTSSNNAWYYAVSKGTALIPKRGD